MNEESPAHEWRRGGGGPRQGEEETSLYSSTLLSHEKLIDIYISSSIVISMKSKEKSCEFISFGSQQLKLKQEKTICESRGKHLSFLLLGNSKPRNFGRDKKRMK